MTRATRKTRGSKTQALLARRWRDIGLFKYATDAGAGRSGSDLLNTEGLAVEIKATATLSLQAGLRQAAAGAVASDSPDAMPILVWRHNGQGPENMPLWTVSMRLGDFEELWRQAGRGETPGNSR